MFDAQRVAFRYLASRDIEAAGTEADIIRNLPQFVQAMSNLSSAILTNQSQGKAGDSYSARFDANRPWVALIQAGGPLVDGILSTRSIPARDAKGMELAYRLMHNSRRMPQDVYKWWDTNLKRLDLIVQAAKSWPPKQEGSDELFTLGSFKVHNTVGAKGSELDSLKNAIERVENLCRKNPIPGFSRVVYGDIHVVARITKAHHAAWYFPGDDSLYLRRSKTTGIDEVHAMIHELGHRYWHKFASEEAKKEWQRHHWQTEGKPVEVDLPKVGDPIPVKIPKIKEYPTITKIEGGRFYYEVDIGGGEKWQNSLPAMKVREFYSAQQKASKNFPTTYSATSAQEHFCDALALLAMGNLTAQHEIPFNAIWNR